MSKYFKLNGKQKLFVTINLKPSVMAKIIKRLVKYVIIVHMTKTGSLFGGQHGFRKDMSIETNLI